jgi:NDP-sugar pyrophosphorylase family protein
MDVRAIILVGAPIEPSKAADGDGTSMAQLRDGTISRVPIPLLPLFGRSLISRVAERLILSGVDNVTVLATCEAPFAEPRTLTSQVSWKIVPAENLCRAAEDEFADLAQRGAELVLVLRMGPYVEINLDNLLQFHIDQRSRVTQVWDSQGPMDLFVISSSRRNDAAHLFRTGLTRSRVPVREFRFSGYVNRLEHPRDFRQLTIDSFSLKTAIQPDGKQIRPGIWKEDGAKIDRGARIVAPAYIGAHSQIRASALLTRGSAIEHHCFVDCGTAIDNSTVLPFSQIGAGLDLCNSILAFRQVTSLSRNVTAEIEDPKLVRAVSQAASVRLLAQAAEMIAYLPKQIWRGLSGVESPQPVSIAETTNVEMQHYEPPRIGDCTREDSKVFDSDLAVVRRYGNQ